MEKNYPCKENNFKGINVWIDELEKNGCIKTGVEVYHGKYIIPFKKNGNHYDLTFSMCKPNVMSMDYYNDVDVEFDNIEELKKWVANN